MARTIFDIKNTIGNYYINQAEIKAIYGFTDAQLATGYAALFSSVAPTSLLFYALAFAINLIEQIQDTFRAEIQSTIDNAFVANKAWWHREALKFQRGDNLVINPTTYKYEYQTLDAGKQMVKKVAVREEVQADGACKVKLYVATQSGGAIAALDPADRALFGLYANQIKPSGVLIETISGDGDVVKFGFTVYYNPLLINSSGELLTDGTKPVELALAKFIDTLNDTNFGGKLNLTRATDAIQNAEGIVDVRLFEFFVNDEEQDLTNLTYESTNGWFTLDSDNNIEYQPQMEL